MPTQTIAQHTQGPWEVVKHAHVDDELWLSVNQHADVHGLKEWIAEIKYLTTDPDRQWANARLISAAPDLLAALKACQRLIVEALSRFDWGASALDANSIQLLNEVPLVLRTAIAKAEGQP